MLRQVKVRYDQLEDRLQLTLFTDPQAHHLVLTRRIWIGARLAFQHILERSSEVPKVLPAGLRSHVVASHHYAMSALTPATCKTDSEERVPTEASLVTAIRFGERSATPPRLGRAWFIRFDRLNRPQLTLALNDKTLHALVSALRQCEVAAQWSLPALSTASTRPAEHRVTLQ